MNVKENEFMATVSQDGDGTTILLQGEINSRADTDMTAAYEQAVAGSLAEVILDFNQVDYINSTGIALIVGLLAKARMANIHLTAVGLSDHYREIFTITRLSDFIDIQ
ncbi:MAG: STAS domain-containing protein [Candidatus Promineifilaceae bacterium]